MRDVDRLHTEYPFMGARMLRDKLALQGDRIGRRHVARLMRVMGIEALYAQKSTSRRHPQHFVFQYLLRDITIEKPNHVWCADSAMTQPSPRSLVVIVEMYRGRLIRHHQNGVESYDVKEFKSKSIALNGTAFSQLAKRS